MATTPPKPPSPLSSLESKLDELANIVPMGAATDSRAPLGLPRETLAEQRPGFQPFIEGDEWAPQSLPPAEKRRLQLIMERAGVLPEQGYSPAVWDKRSASAYTQVLSLANSMGTRDVEQALTEYATQAQTYAVKTKAPRAPLVTRLADPEAVRGVIRDSAYKLLGRRLNDADEARLIASYQGQSAAYQQALYGAEETGGTVTEVDPQARLQAQMEADYGPEIEVQRAGSFLDRITQLGPQVKRPTIQGG